MNRSQQTKQSLFSLECRQLRCNIRMPSDAHGVFEHGPKTRIPEGKPVQKPYAELSLEKSLEVNPTLNLTSV
jgi:hypothetical protein